MHNLSQFSSKISLEERLNEWKEIRKINEKRFEKLFTEPNFKLRLDKSLVSCGINSIKVKYVFGPTQLGKSEFKFKLAHYSLSNDHVDVVIIATTNMTDASDQLFARANNYRPFRTERIQIKKASNLSESEIVGGEVIIGLANGSQLGKLREAIECQCRQTKSMGTKKVRYLLILDEGEQRDAGAGGFDDAALADENLHNLVFDMVRNHSCEMELLPVWKISATLNSALIDHATNFKGMYEPTTIDDIFELPVSNDYVGIGTGKKNNWGWELRYNRCFVEENKDALKGELVALQNSPNVRIICDELWRHWKDTEINPYVIKQVANVVFPSQKEGHFNLACVMHDHYTRNGLSSFIFMEPNDLVDANGTEEIAIVIHNGDTNEMSISDKLYEVARITNGNIKLVIIVSKRMAGRSVTFDCGDSKFCERYERMYEPSDFLFGMYCNVSVIYTNEKENIEALVQYHRCTGNRPPIKYHSVITTPEIAECTESGYNKLTSEMMKDLIKYGKWDKLREFDDTFGDRRLGTMKQDNRFNRTIRNPRQRVSEKERVKLALSGIVRVDSRLQIEKELCDKVKQAKNISAMAEELCDILESRGFCLPTEKKLSFSTRFVDSSELSGEEFRKRVRNPDTKKDVNIRIIKNTDNSGETTYWLFGLIQRYAHSEIKWLEYAVTKNKDNGTLDWNPTYVLRDKNKHPVFRTSREF